MKLIYKTRYKFFPVFIICGSNLFLIFFTNLEVLISATKIFLILYAFVFNVYFKRFVFYENTFLIDYPLRFFFRKRNYSYSKIKIFEIRMRQAPYSWPKIVLHYEKWYTSEYLFNDNNFDIINYEQIYPLIKQIIEHKIPIWLHMTIEFEKEFNELSKFILENNGVLHNKTIIE